MPTTEENISGQEEEQLENSNNTEPENQGNENESGEEENTGNNKQKEYTSERAKERALRRDKQTKEDSDFKQKYENLIKEQQNERSLRDRQLNELRQAQLSEEDRKLIKEISDLKKKSEMDNLKKTNPDEYQRKLVQDTIDERLKAQKNPTQEINQEQQTFTPEQFNQWGNQATQQLMANPEIGQEHYKIMEPMMVDILKNTPPDKAALLLQNPEALYEIAIGKAYRNKMKEQSQQQIAGTQKANQFHEGTAKPNNGSKKNVDYSKMSDKDLEKLKNEELMKEYGLTK